MSSRLLMLRRSLLRSPLLARPCLFDRSAGALLAAPVRHQRTIDFLGLSCSSVRRQCTTAAEAPSSSAAAEGDIPVPPASAAPENGEDTSAEDYSDELDDYDSSAEEEDAFPLLVEHMRPKGDTSRKYVKIDEMGRAYSRGARKTAVARVWVWKHSKPDSFPTVRINDSSLAQFFGGHWQMRHTVLAPFFETGTAGEYGVLAKVHGGGRSTQSQAVRLGVATALQGLDPSLRPALKAAGFMTRDRRIVERKKPGQRGARAKFRWVKR